MWRKTERGGGRDKDIERRERIRMSERKSERDRERKRERDRKSEREIERERDRGRKTEEPAVFLHWINSNFNRF